MNFSLIGQEPFHFFLIIVAFVVEAEGFRKIYLFKNVEVKLILWEEFKMTVNSTGRPFFL